MRRSLLFLLVFGAISVTAQTLVCPSDPSSAGKPCDVFHYHMQLYSPESKALTTLNGINEFATIAACEKAREAHTQQNAAVVDYVKRVKAQAYEADRIGPCHCDVTRHASSPAYVSEAQRDVQLRSAEIGRPCRLSAAAVRIPPTTSESNAGGIASDAIAGADCSCKRIPDCRPADAEDQHEQRSCRVHRSSAG
jgi:hypothetical protein